MDKLSYFKSFSEKIRSYLFSEVNNAPLILFRVAFGLLIFLEGIGAIFTGWVYENMVQPEFTFSFIGFEWIQPLPGYGMYVWFVAMGVAGLSVMTGFYYRTGIAVFTILWTGVYLMQKTSYNNHYYLLVLLSFIMLTLPANRRFALDVYRKVQSHSFTCPQWCITIFIGMMALVYTYGGINKIYPEWISGEVMRIFFSGKHDYFLIGPLLAEELTHHFVAYGGIFFDLFIVPLMLWRKTRPLALPMLLFFHLFNSVVFHIGIFPYMMIAMAVFFYPPGHVDRWFFKGKGEKAMGEEKLTPVTPRNRQNFLLIIFALFFTWQAVLPVRHHFFDSYVNWSEEGHRMSWRMMLRAKHGHVDFYIQDRNSDTEAVKTSFQDRLTPKQAARVALRPDMAWQMAQRIHNHYKEKENRIVSVFARGKVTLNGRPYQPLIDPDRDLAAEEWYRFKSKDWILELDE